MTQIMRLRHWTVTAAVMALAIPMSSPSTLSAQGRSASGSRAYVEVLGNGLVFSVNFEHTVWRELDVRVGAGGLGLEGVKYVLGFAMAGWQVSHGRHAVHVGLGGGIIRFVNVFFLDGRPQTTFYGTAALAYRFQPRPRGMFLQLAFTPVLAESTFSPWPGLAIGYAF